MKLQDHWVLHVLDIPTLRTIAMSQTTPCFLPLQTTTDFLLGRKTSLDDVPAAAHFTKNYDEFINTEGQEIDDYDDYIEFKKAQYKRRHEN